MKDYTLAKIAYDAYAKEAGGKSLATGDPLPDFWILKQEIQDAWQAAADAVGVVITRKLLGPESRGYFDV